MKRRQFIKGSAVLGLTAAGSTLLVSKSGMYHNDSKRKVYRILNSDRLNVGTLPVIRAFAGKELDYVSPYVLFDEFGPVQLKAGSDPLRVDAHPHAGVTPTTYFLEGSGHHKDSLDYDFQIGNHIQIVLGEVFGAKSNIETYAPAFYYHVKMEADSRLDIPTNPTHNAFVYLIKGSLEIEGGRQLKTRQLVLYQRGESHINLYAEEAAEFLVLGGQPLNEPIYSYGPFVMNTKDQIRQCIRNYQQGLMGNPDVVNGI